MGGIKALRKIQFGAEGTPGTPVIATAIYRGIGTAEDMRELVHPPEDVGFISPVDRTYNPKLLAGIEMGAVPATFEQLPYFLAAAIKTVAGVKDGSGSGYAYVYPFPTTALNTIKTFTLELGDNQQMERGEYAFIEELTISGKHEEAVTITSTWKMRQLAPNNYTASTIEFDAETKTITDSANGLAGFPTGSKITIDGTDSNDGTYTVATGATAGSIVVSESLVDEAAGDSVTIEQTFTAVSLPTVEETLFQEGKLFIDAVGGTLGATQKSNTFLEFTIKITSGWKADFTGDGNLYFSKISMGQPEILTDVLFEHDGSSAAEKAYWRAKTSRKMRIQIEGNALTTAGTSYSKKLFLFDQAGTWDKFDALDELNGNDTVKGQFRAAYNATASLFAQATVVNELSALP